MADDINGSGPAPDAKPNPPPALAAVPPDPEIVEAATVLANAFAVFSDSDSKDTDVAPEKREAARVEMVRALTDALIAIATSGACAIVTARAEPGGSGGKQCVVGGADCDIMFTLGRNVEQVGVGIQAAVARLVLRERLRDFVKEDGSDVLFVAKRTPKVKPPIAAVPDAPPPTQPGPDDPGKVG